jgi:hypothetical protein
MCRVLYLFSNHMEYLNKRKQTRTEHAYIHITNTVLTQIQTQARKQGTLAIWAADNFKTPLKVTLAVKLDHFPK